MNNLDLRHKDMLRGLLFIAGGVALLLHTLGFIQKGVNVALIIVALLAIFYGYLKSGLHEVVLGALRKKR